MKSISKFLFSFSKNSLEKTYDLPLSLPLSFVFASLFSLLIELDSLTVSKRSFLNNILFDEIYIF